MRIIAALTAVCTAAVIAGCSSGESPTPAGRSTVPAVPAAGDDLGRTFEFTRAGDGSAVGSVRFMEAIAVPADCLAEPVPAGTQAIGLRIELANVGNLELIRPGADFLQANDANGFSQNVGEAELASRCRSRYPELAKAPAPGKAAGWVAILSPVPNPAELVYTPLVWSEDASITNFDVVEVDPDHVVVKLPAIPAATPAAAPPPPTPTAQAPSTTTPPSTSAPAAGQSCNPVVDDRATDANGGALKCTYAGSATARWVSSLPYIGIQTPGAPCELGVAVAESPTGATLVCVGTPEAGYWQAGP